MTTTRSLSLDRIGEALVDAHQVIDSTGDEQAIENALVVLCRSAYDVLVEWEVSCARDEDQVPLQPETWRTPLDELRLQAALAEMELRATGTQGRRAAERLAHVVGHQVATARQDVGGALESLRSELRKVLS
jgi:hypothetical protein